MPGLEEATLFQSTLPARGATSMSSSSYRYGIISIHAPRTGSDELMLNLLDEPLQFQSTLPARGATATKPVALLCALNFNPRSPHGERRCRVFLIFRRVQHFNPRSPHGARQRSGHLPAAKGIMSIHAPRTGSDGGGSNLSIMDLVFQSTLPARGATYLSMRLSNASR